MATFTVDLKTFQTTFLLSPLAPTSSSCQLLGCLFLRSLIEWLSPQVLRKLLQVTSNSAFRTRNFDESGNDRSFEFRRCDPIGSLNFPTEFS